MYKINAFNQEDKRNLELVYPFGGELWLLACREKLMIK